MAKQMDRQKQSARKDTAKKTADKACKRPPTRRAARIAAEQRTATKSQRRPENRGAFSFSKRKLNTYAKNSAAKAAEKIIL